jgi:PhzF family phenazine biosynthesis protein
LSALSAELGCNGYYPFSLDAPSVGTFSSGRMFAPAIGIAEDPVTGNAAGPLGAYLLHNRLVVPGADHRSSPSAAVDVRIAGQAVVVFQSELEMQPV